MALNWLAKGAKGPFFLGMSECVIVATEILL